MNNTRLNIRIVIILLFLKTIVSMAESCHLECCRFLRSYIADTLLCWLMLRIFRRMTTAASADLFMRRIFFYFLTTIQI